MTATRSPATVTPTADGKTRVSLDLPMGGSCFVVFAPGEGSCLAAGNRPLKDDAASCIPLANSWHVSFAYHDGITAAPPKPIAMDSLRDWTSFGEKGKAGSGELRYFSGTATYRTTAMLPAGMPAASRAVLSLGELPTGLAHVFVNGVDCGTVWCAPWTADISAAVRPGKNDVEVRYINNWFNRLVGDCCLPEAERVTRSTLRYWQKPRSSEPGKRWRVLPTVYSGPSSFDTLQPSGLLGPVVIRLAASRPDGGLSVR